MSEQPSSELTVPQRNLVVRAVMRSDVGLVRSENQDFGAYTTTAEERESHLGGRLLIVADGMGGHRGGATASRLAAETVKAQFLGTDLDDVTNALRDALTRANARIFSEAQSNPELRGMGTTTSVLAVRGEHGWLAHVGDSRIYLVRGDTIRQLTEDHSLVATMVREGLLTSQEAETHPRRNVLQRSMGVAEEVEVDVKGPFELREGDTFILCSDGLHGLVKEPELKEIARESIEKAADEFLRRALERGAPDNVTVIVARVEVSDDPADAPYIADPLDQTQPLDPLELAQFEDTVREAKDSDLEAEKDTAKIGAVADKTPTMPIRAVTVPETAERPAVPPASTPAPEPAARTVAQPPAAMRSAAAAARPAPAPRKSMFRWILLAMLVLGAVGAWFVWSQQQALVDEPRASSTAR